MAEADQLRHRLIGDTVDDVDILEPTRDDSPKIAVELLRFGEFEGRKGRG